jgi:hypothetical protein
MFMKICAKKHVKIVSYDTKPLVFVKPIVDKKWIALNEVLVQAHCDHIIRPSS